MHKHLIFPVGHWEIVETSSKYTLTLIEFYLIEGTQGN